LTKLIIQIPCFNEETSIAGTLEDIPSTIEGIDEIETLVIDDGSEDNTSHVAREMGVDRIIRLPKNTGLANAFSIGLQVAVEMGADIIVNTDGDHQYPGKYIADLIAPILSGKAEFVVGDRQVDRVSHFSRWKRFLQKLGSAVVRWASNTDIPDTTSGFRAITSDAASRLVIFSDYTYTLETIIQAGKKGIAITSIPIEVNPIKRRSRLITSNLSYILKSAATITRIFLLYEALRVFLTISAFPFVAGMALLLRYGYFYIIGDSQGHIQSLIIASILLILAFQTTLLGLLADLIGKNRRLSEDIQYRLRRKSSDSLDQHRARRFQ
jgi:glycosyltransferase involved in cell wall biosynthesis